jgi:hypothetical protein
MHTMVSSDTVMIFEGRRLVIENSLIDGGRMSTFDPMTALKTLTMIQYLGDEIPIGALTEVRKLC